MSLCEGVGGATGCVSVSVKVLRGKGINIDKSLPLACLRRRRNPPPPLFNFKLMQFMKTFVRSIANTSVQVYNLCHFYALPLVMPKQFLSFGKFAFVFARAPILISQRFFFYTFLYSCALGPRRFVPLF